MIQDHVIKILSACLALLVLSLTFVSAVSAVETEDRVDVPDVPRSDESREDTVNQGDTLPISVAWVKVNGDMIENGDTLRESFDRGDDLNIKVKVQALADVHDLSVEARIAGDEHYLISDFSDNIDFLENDTLDTIELNLHIPEIMDVEEGDSYKLRITLTDRYSAGRQYNYNLKIMPQDHSVVVRDVFFSPQGQIQAGRALLSVVRLENLGETDEDSVRVTVSVPDLDVSATDYIDEVEQDDEVSSEELYMRIPLSAKPGMYDVVVSVDYDERTRQIQDVYQIQVLASPQAEAADEDAGTPGGKTVVTIGPESQNAPQGEAAVFPVTLNNQGKTSKSYTVMVGGVEAFGSAQVSPSNVVVLSPGETKTVYVSVTVSPEAQLGAKTFSVEIRSGDKTLQSVPLSVNVLESEEEADWGSVKKGLEIGLVVLIVLLVILGVVIAFVKSKKGEEEEAAAPSGEQTTYY